MVNSKIIGSSFFRYNLSACLIALSAIGFMSAPGFADDATDAAMSVEEEQAKEKIELDDMKKEMNDIKGTINDAVTQMNRAQTQLQKAITTKEFHLVAKDSNWQIMPGVNVQALTYNGVIPGTVLRVQEGDTVKVVLHNQLKIPTSLYFYGMALPGTINSLPRQNAGLVKPGETYVYQFTAGQQGTYFYHPQVNHQEQGLNGLWGALIVEPPPAQKSYDKDFVFVIGEFSATAPQQPAQAPLAASDATGKSSLATGRSKSRTIAKDISSDAANAGKVTYYTINGKSAPNIPYIEVLSGERIRLRLINTTSEACPIHLSGHRFEIIATDGSDGLEPHITRDTIVLQPSQRADVEFIADNPGVWSLASQLPSQTNNNGKFPGGIACVLRYQDVMPAKSAGSHQKDAAR